MHLRSLYAVTLPTNVQKMARRSHGRVGQAEQLGGQACPELVALAHEQVRLPPLGKGEQVEHGSPRRGITPVGNDPAGALGAGRRDVGEGLRHHVVAPVKPGREGGEASRLDITANRGQMSVPWSADASMLFGARSKCK